MPDETRASAVTSKPRWAEGSGARIAHAVGLALLNQAALLVPLVAIAPSLTGDVNPFDAPPAAFLLLAIIILLQAGLVVGLGLLRGGRVSPRDLGWRSDTIGRAVGPGLVGFALVATVVMGMRFATGGHVAVTEGLRTIASYSVAQRALFFAIGLVAAFAEESIFRGYLQPALMRRVGATAGVVVTAAIFAVYHLQFAPLRLAALFSIGLIYGVLRMSGPSLFAPAIAHWLCWAVLGAI
jgi:membrane protease YdiL (CAAX protease family)